MSPKHRASSLLVVSISACLSVAIGAVPHARAQSWIRFAGVDLGTYTSLEAVHISADNDVWAVGGFSDPNQTPKKRTLIEHWNGASWSSVASPNVTTFGNGLSAVDGVAPNDVWAVGSAATGDATYPPGQSLALHWDGTSWTPIPSPSPNFAQGFADVKALAPNDVWAVGFTNVTHNASQEQTFIAHWNGNAWAQVAAPTVAPHAVLNAIAGTAANDLWAVGYSRNAPSDSPLILHWDGSAWTITSSVPNPGGTGTRLNAASAVSANDVWAVGYAAASEFPEKTRAIALHWNGSNWIDRSPPAATSDRYLFAATGAAANDVWALGNEVTSDQHALALHWIGGGWTAATLPSASSGWLHAAAMRGNTIWAVGTQNNGKTRTLILRGQ